MTIETLEMERMQSTWENIVDYDLGIQGFLRIWLGAREGYLREGCAGLPRS